jgi:type IV pilus assembly protein PilX
MTSLRTPPSPRTQRGVVLIIALMFLVALTLLAIASMGGTTLEERMAGQYRDLNVAFQAAEAALRDAERDLYGVGAAPPATFTPRAVVISGRTGFGDGTDSANGSCTDSSDTNYGRGLCYPRDTGPYPRFPTADLSTASTVAVPYGTYTGATALQNVSAQPRYLIEALWSGIPPGAATSIGAGASPMTYYRITARGFGANTVTQLTLQEMYLKPQL